MINKFIEISWFPTNMERDLASTCFWNIFKIFILLFMRKSNTEFSKVITNHQENRFVLYSWYFNNNTSRSKFNFFCFLF